MKTLIWKEWREQRLFFFLAVGLIVLSRIVPYFLPGKMLDYDLYVAACCFILPILFSLLLGATSFNGEFIRNTKPFLLSQPLTSRRLFWVKFLSGLIIFFVLALLAQSVFILFPFKGKIIFNTLTKTDFQSIFRFILPIFLSLLVLYSTACFSSLLLKNNLPAIICTPFVLIFGVLPVLPLSIVLFLVSPNAYIFAVLIASILIAVFLILGFQTWQKAIVKDVSPLRTIFSTAIAILLISFAVHALANLAATWKLSKTIQQAEAAGIKLTIQEIIPPPVPDKDNAALIYQQAFDLAEKLGAAYKIKINSFPWGAQFENLNSEQKVGITKIVKDPEFAKFYALVQKAANLPSCRFDLKYEEGPSMPLSHLNNYRKLARLIAAHTYILTQEGKYKEALESAKTELSLGDSLSNEPILISQLVRTAADKNAVESFQPLLKNSNGAISIKDCQNIILEINKKDRQIAKKGLEGEPSVGGLYFFRLVLGEIRANFHGMEFSNGKKVTDFADFIGYLSSKSPRPFVRFSWKFYGSYLGRPILKGDYIFYVRSFSTLMKLSQEPYFSTRIAASNWERIISRGNLRNMKHPLSSMLLPALSSVFNKQATHNATLDSFKLSLALKIYKQKYGYYPDKIASLSPEVISQLPLDPFTGKDYIYRKEGRGFILYSIGPNEKDDNGIYDQKQSQKFDDIAWKVLN